ncbi:MAG: amino acid adenylation domain-containing protein [Azospirillaceae bacterium]|nr:amino acid adenylation domain-containing protein [Azospirillaceae bacterium]
MTEAVVELDRRGLGDGDVTSKRSEGPGFPLSAAQLAMWLAEEVGGERREFLIGARTDMYGPLDVALFRRAVASVVDAADSLRVAFVVGPDGPYQSPVADFALPLEVIDLSDQPDPEAALETLQSSWLARPFWLDQPPLFGLLLARIGPEHHGWLFRFHHLVADGVGVQVFTTAVVQAYQALADGRTPVLDLGAYREVPAGDTVYAASERYRQDLAYWRSRHPSLASPLFPRTAERGSRVWTPPVQRYLPRARYDDLLAACRERGVAPFPVFIAALAVSALRLTGEHDLSLGLPIANRAAKDKRTVGLFANVLPLRLAIEGRDSLLALVERIARQLRQDYRHQRLPASELARSLGAFGSTGGRLYDVILSYEPLPFDTAMGSVRLVTQALTAGFEREPLAIFVRDFPAQSAIRLDFAFNPHHLERTTVARWADAFMRVIDAFCAHADMAVLAVPVLEAAERRRILEDWNATAQAMPEACVHQLFEAQAAARPDAIAVVFRAETLRYGALNARANQLADYLRGLGVGPETRVVLCLERSVELVVAILAVLKAGGAYLPLDPDYPAERLASIVEDSDAAVVLTSAALQDRLPASRAATVTLDTLALDTVAPNPVAPNPVVLDGLAPANRAGAANPDSLAYVIYTSGSTGKPKGVAISHRAILNHTLWLNETFGLTPADRVLQKTSVAFDASVWELLSPLAAGAVLVLAPAEARHDAGLLAELVARHGITLLQLVPSQLEMLLDAGPGGALTGLRRLFCGGEALSAALAARWHRTATTELVNLYGPTEATIDSLFAMVQGSGTPPIGRPVANARAYVLDRYLEPVPVGVAGELYIGGAGLARGYLGRPGLTAERFVPDPFGPAGGRLYRTGDLVRWRADGEIEFLDRIDQQVKIRGFRIELGEIEAALTTHPGVRQAVVLAREDRLGGKRLVGYVVLRHGQAVTPTLLRDHLGKSLPDFMVPAAFVVLDALPLMPNGKVDRKALPAPEVGTRNDMFVAPRTGAEAAVAAIMAEALGVERVGVADDFFALGGHSLAALRMVSRIRAALGVELTMREVFDHPTVAELAALMDSRAPAAPAANLVDPVPAAVTSEPSAAQWRLWFVAQAEGPNNTYNMPAAFRVEGPLHVGALERAVALVVERHESLRYSFPACDGHPQIAVSDAPFLLSVVDATALSAAEQDESVGTLAAREAAHAFDIERGPLFRAFLLRLADTAHVLFLNMHHIVSDDRSILILLREIGQAYAAFRTGRAPSLPPLPRPLSDLRRDQSHREAVAAERQRGYWKARMADAPDLIALPTDRPRPRVQRFHGAAHSFPFPDVTALRKLSRAHGTTLFTTLLTAFGLLLQRYCRQDDLVVGTPVTNRTSLEAEAVIGFFVNMLPLRLNLSGNPTFATLLDRVRLVVMDDIANADLPFDQLVEALRPQRSSEHTPLFQVMFDLLTGPMDALALDGLAVSPVPLDYGVAKYELTLTVQDSPAGPSGSIEYNTDLFDAATIVRMAGHFRVLVEAIAADPEAPLAAYPLMEEEEARRVRALGVPADRTRLPSFVPFIQRFEAHAATRPATIALSHEGNHLSYAALNAWANAAARALMMAGVGPGHRVGLYVQHRPEMVAAILAVLKAGGAYLPLPLADARLGFVVADAAPKVILSTGTLAARLEGLGLPVLCLDDPGVADAGEPNPPCRTGPGDPAYVIYTSGSTGRPKGVLVGQDSLASAYAAWEIAYGLRPGETTLQTASHTFDAFTGELVRTLGAGSRLVLCPRETLLEPARLFDLIDAERVDIVEVVPAVLRQLLAYGHETGRTLQRVRLMTCGADQWFVHEYRAAQRLFPQAVVMNVYGITEATIDSTMFVQDDRVLEVDRVLPIGWPLANTEAHVLDADLRLVPLGVPGELVLGGPAVAQGYHNRPELTAARFVAGPPRIGRDDTADGARLFRTGDLCRRLADGTLELLGRLDHQVKVRGFRIEPGEIEHALAQCPGVEECVVVARPDPSGETILAGYVRTTVPVPAIREHLRARLPSHMVPSALVRVEAFALTASGKIDRKALPDPQPEAPPVQEPPRTPIEATLAALWAEVLKRPGGIGIHDNFFDLGGHSLLAVRLCTRVREAFGCNMPVGLLFEHPTLAALAAALDTALDTGDAAPGDAGIGRAGGVERERLSFAQKRLWFLAKMQTDGAVYAIPDAIRLRGPLDSEALRLAVGDLVARHQVLRTVFSPDTRRLVTADGTGIDEPVQTVLPAGPVPLPRVDLQGIAAAARDDEARGILEQEARQPFELSRDPPIRALLVALGPDDHILLVTMHHIASDGWSAAIFWAELSACYAFRLAGQPPALPALAVQYADFAAWQRAHCAGPACAAQIAYWRARLAELPAGLDLPTDRPRPALPSFEGGSLLFRVDAGLSERLERRCRELDCTPFMLLIAVFATLLHRYTGQDDIVIGTPVAGRTRREIEPLIGFFINLLPLRLSFDGKPAFSELVARTRQASLEAQANQDVPFDLLVTLLNPERAPDRHPLFQVMLVLQNLDVTPPQFPGLVATPVPVDLGRAKLDLLLAMERDADGFAAMLDYRRDLFDAATIERMKGHFLALLDAAVTESRRPVATLEMLTAHERHQLLWQWNDTTAPYPNRTGIHHLFERQAQARPEATAVEFGAVHWTYRELDRRATAIAMRLAGLGIGQGHTVGLAAARHPNLIAAMLGVLKAGAAYLPLDPGAPPERIDQISTDAGVAALVGWQGAVLPDRRGLPVLDLSGDDAVPEATVTDGAPFDSLSIANVIYTSGSAGQPKGVPVPHRGLVSMMLSMLKSHALDGSSRQLQFLAPSFDAAILDLLAPLLAGATVVMAPREDLLPGPGLLRLLREQRITHLAITPSALRMLPVAELPDLHTLILGGEACPDDLARQWAQGRRLVNGYGPTECSVCVSASEYGAEGGRLVLRPIANTRLHVLDRDLNLLPVGVPGELCIGGILVTGGYLNRPEQTAAAFVTDPFAEEPGAWLYRSGDKVRRLPDGALEFLGRVDQQVKIRGFRIEPDEVEAALVALPGVQAGAVAAKPGPGGQAQLVAYVVGTLDRTAVLSGLRQRLPSHMVPTAVVFVDALPLTPHGKVDRKALPAPDAATVVRANPSRGIGDTTEKAVAAIWCALLDREAVDPDDNFFEIGGHSLLVASMQSRLVEQFDRSVSITDIFQYPTVRALARFLGGSGMPRPADAAATPPADGTRSAPAGADIAVIGMAGRFPGAVDLETFWHRLAEGRDSVVFFTDDELLASGVDPALLRHRHYVKAGIPLEDKDRFDAPFFGYAPREAQLMDPQHRLFLECAWQAMESAGYGAEDGRGAVGVFASSSFSHYLLNNLYPHRDLIHSEAAAWMTGNDKDFLPTRVAYKLNLRGPAIAVGTACSSSLVAVHLACKSLLQGECDMALAGGVSVEPETGGYLYTESGILSPDGRCRAFDAQARGTSGGNGCAVLILKPLAAALNDRDTIHAVIRGSAINNDGMDKVSYTAPSVTGQAEVVRKALRAARVEPDSIGYVEAHGTGTELGDPIEVEALNQAYGAPNGPDGRHLALPPASIPIGSLKTNIGHLDAAAGAAGLIKVVLALKHRQIPPSLNFTVANPRIDFAAGPFFVNTALRAWDAGTEPRRAAISSFGIGGTNAHAVVEEAPRLAAPAADPRRQVLVLSARSDAALRAQCRALARHLRRTPVALADAAFTLQLGRQRFAHRVAVVASTAEDAVTRLERRTVSAVDKRVDRPVVFLFPGQGSQHVAMAQGLYAAEPVFRAAFDSCADILAEPLGLDLRDLVHPKDPADREDAERQLRQTAMAQPALFAVEYALATLLMGWGIVPRAMMGHSLGEYVAACLSGVFELPEALALVARRGALMQAQPVGAMLAIQAPEMEVATLLGDGVELAAVNGPRACVVTGPEAAIAATVRRCAERGLESRRLATSHAFHSAMMDEAAAGLRESFQGLRPGAPVIPFVSNLDGRWITADRTADPGYWADQLRRPVRFADGLRTLLELDDPLLVEVGPGRALTAMRDQIVEMGRCRLVPAMRHARDNADDHGALLDCVADLWMHGAAVNWRALHGDAARARVPLPTYPFERNRYWIDPPRHIARTPVAEPAAATSALVRGWTEEGPGRAAFRVFASPKHWMFDEHRVFTDRPVLPGTGCLELVRAAFVAWTGAAAVELREVYFLTPLILESEVPQEVRLSFAARDQAFDFTLTGPGADPDAPRLLHAQGIVRAADGSAPPCPTLDELRQHDGLVSALPEGASDPRLDAAMTLYGPRWHCIREVWLNQGVGLARLRLDPAFAGDLDRIGLHPALLDMATAFLSLWQPEDGGIPYHYRRLTQYAPLPEELFSLVRRTAPGTYDVTVMTLRGDGAPVVLAEIEGYTQRAPLVGGPAGEPAGELCRALEWRPAPDTAAPPATAATDAGGWLLFADGDETATALAALLPAGSVRVRRGDAFRRCDDGSFAVAPGDAASYRRLLSAVASDGPAPRQVLFAWALDNSDAAGAAPHRAMALFEELATLVPLIGTPGSGQDAAITVLTRGAHPGAGPGPYDPAAAVLLGLLRAVPAEFPWIACRHIDLDAGFDGLADELRRPLSAAETGEVATVALRARQRLVPVQVPLPLAPPLALAEREDPVRDGAAFLITGGLGGIGLAIARHLAGKARVGLVLTSRSPVPDRATRPELADPLDALRAAGADVMVVQADAADPEAMARAVAALRGRFGRVAGVVHAAGLEASGMLGTFTPEAARRVFAPKVLGTDILARLVRDDRPEVFVLCSSLASLHGGLGQADYAAANAYLDAVVHGLRADGLPATAVNWDSWTEVGMAVAHVRQRFGEKALTSLEGLSTRDALAALDRVMRGAPPQAVIARPRPMAPAAQARATFDPGADPGARPALATPFIAPRTAVERSIARIWQDLLGLDAVGVEDNFFDLGGHSLLGTQVISRVRDIHKNAPTLADFLAEPTIARICRSIGDAPAIGAAGEAGDRDIRFCLVPVSAVGAGTPFFCVPGMGGNVAQLLPLATSLGDDRPFYALQSLGLDGTVEPHATVQAMAEHYVRCIRSVQAKGPYLLGGHSLGGKVIYEMAVQLQRQGQRVNLMAFLDSSAPPYRDVGGMDDAGAIGSVLNTYAYFFNKPVEIDYAEYRRIGTLAFDDKLAYLRDRLEGAGLIRRGTDTSAIRGLVKVFRATADFGYDPPKLALPVPFVLYKGVAELPPTIILPEIRENAWWGWEKFSTRPVEIHDVPGDHFSCLVEPNVSVMAALLRERLRQADRDAAAAP